jgi:hypothetical protein
MKRLIVILLLCSAASYAADVHFTWLLTFNTVLGLPTPDTPQYGAQVFMDSDNPKVTEFQVTVVAQMPNGNIVTKTGTVAKDGKSSGVMYSTVYVAWFGADPNFQVLSIQVKGVVEKSTTKPFPGRDYSSDDNTSPSN